MVINQLDTGKFASCPTIDACPKDLSGDDVYRMLVHNFKRHYLTNRAPYGLHFHSSWFKNQEYLIAIQVRLYFKTVTIKQNKINTYRVFHNIIAK